MSSSSRKKHPVKGSNVKQSASTDVHHSQEEKPKQYQPQQVGEARLSKANHNVEKLNDGVYQVYLPHGNPRAQIVFVHGIRKKDFKKAYMDTWMTSDRSECWPQVWLPRRFRRAAVYFVSYDSSAAVDSTHGRLDMFTAGEQILTNLLLARVGQSSSCPLILVGHDLGGLVIKYICLQAYRGRETGSTQSEKMRMFLTQIKGVFYFSTPHGGVYLNKKHEGAEVSDMMAALKTFDKKISRCNEEFRVLRQLPMYKWKTKGVHPSHGPKPGQLNFSTDASGRGDVDDFFTIDADSDDICKPRDETSSSFQFLVQFVEDLIVSFANHHKRALPFSPHHSYVPIMKSIEEIQGLLWKKKIVVLYGEPGTGKSSLAKYVALKYQRQTKHDSMFWDGCFFVECGRKDRRSILEDFLLQLGADSRDEMDLSSRLRHLDALIVLDDVLDHDTVRQFIVPRSKVKCLLTAQPSCVWKDDDDIASCRMEKISYDHGRQIVARKVGFRDGSLPKDIEGVVEDLLNATDCHPLALATLSMAVQKRRKAIPEEWIMVKRSMDALLKQDREGVKPAAFGTKYPRGVYTSMMYAMERLHERSRDLLKLLCIIAIFEEPSVPITLIQVFVKNTDALGLPDEDAGVYRLVDHYCNCTGFINAILEMCVFP